MSETMKVKCTLHAQASQWEEGGFSFHVYNREDMSSVGYVQLDTVEVEFKTPPRDVLVNGAVAAYRAEQSRLRAEVQVKCDQLDDAIQKLLCIEDKS